MCHTGVRSSHGVAPITCRISTKRGEMPLALSVPFRDFVRLVPAATVAVMLAACNQTMPVASKADLNVAGREAAQDGRSVVRRRVAIRAIKHTPYKRTAHFPATSYGIASFYSEDQQTANGEK